MIKKPLENDERKAVLAPDVELQRQQTVDAVAEQTQIKAPTQVKAPAGSTAYSSRSYSGYVPSDAVKQAQALLQQQLANKPGNYESQWQEQINSYFDQIQNRQPFQYNYNEDPLYEHYRNNYIRGGQLAMMDTMGQASTLTGGYGNSYAQSVGQQAYNDYMAGLSNVIPELYQQAYGRYADEGDNLLQQYGLLMDRENSDYARYLDSLNAWQAERDYLTGRYDTERSWDYGQYVDSLSRRSSGGPLVEESYDLGNLTQAGIADLQKALGVRPTGTWDEATAQMAYDRYGTKSAMDVYRILYGNVDANANGWIDGETKATKAFQNALMPRDRFDPRIGGGNYASYEAYVEAMLEKAVNSGKLRDDEVYYLMDIYGL